MVDVMGCISSWMRANSLWHCFLEKGNSTEGDLVLSTTLFQ